MTQVQENISLRGYNSFGIDATARYFSTFRSIADLQAALDFSKENDSRILILGGGSNMLFTQDFHGLVLKNEIAGLELTGEDEDFVFVKCGAGENWHQFVLHCVKNGWGGIENLSLIPGCTGASPMQNIGAYGVEIKDVFHQLTAFQIRDRRVVTFGLQDCKFGYRESVFKREYKDQFVILDVTLRLSKRPIFNTSYGAIEQELEKMGIQDLSIKAISQAVINIRSSKLPDPKQIGNAGSFFKNPSVPSEKFQELQSKFPGIIGYPNDDKTVKLAAGWLIEQCGWKGFRTGDAGVHAKQALVLVNYGTASGSEIYQLSEDIIGDVLQKFNVTLEREVNIIGNSHFHG